MDRLTSMGAFVKVVDLGSLTAAAAALGLSAPMVGKHLRALEQRLGVHLLERTTRRQRLTEVGRAYYEQCRVVLAEADVADALAEVEHGIPRGRLRVTMPALFGRRCVAPVLLRLAQQHPQLQLTMSFTDEFVDIEDGYDLAIRSFAVRNDGLENRAGLATRLLARQVMVVCAAPAYLAAHGAPATPADLDRHQAILYVRRGQVRPWHFPVGAGEPVAVVPPHRLQLDDLEAIAEAAIAGMGLAWLPQWLLSGPLADGRLVTVMADQPGLAYESYALWRHAPQLSPRLRAAIDALVNGLPRTFA